MDMNNQIAICVRQIDSLEAEKDELWTKASKLVADGHVEKAISLLNRYFSMKVQLEGLESRLAGMLKDYFSDK
jgi:hypothetical protein